MAGIVSERHQRRDASLTRRRLIEAGLAVGAAAVVFGAVDLFSRRDGTSNAPRDSYLINYDEGSFSLSHEQREILGRMYPEVPGELKLHFLDKYDTPHAHHSLGVYNKALPVDEESVDIIRQHTQAFAGNAHLLEGQNYNGLSFSAQVRSKFHNIQLTVPSHFPLPGEKPPQNPGTGIEWSYLTDDKANAFVAVIRTPDLGEAERKSHAISLADAINASSAAKSIELVVPDGRSKLSSDEERLIYEAMGDAAVAKTAGATYQEYLTRIRRSGHVWMVPETMFDALPTLPPVFFI